MAEETSPKPTLLEFLKRLVGDTTSLVSGGLSVPLTVMSLFSDNRYAKVAFGVLAVTGFLIASYRLWSGERRNTLAIQGRLIEEINKRGRPEITVELKGEGSGLHACLMNYASIAAINLRIDDIPCAGGVLRFENIPTMISSGFSPNLQCCFVPSDGSPQKRDIIQELIFDKDRNPERSKYVLAIRYTDSDGVLDWVTKCDFAYHFEQRKIVLLKQWIEDGEAENAIRELREYDQRRANPAQKAVKWLRNGGYVETTPVTHMQSAEEEYLVTKITDKARLLLNTKRVENSQAKLLAAQMEEIEARKKSRQAEEEREARMNSLTAPDTGIRQFVAAETARKKCAQAFTVDMLASSLAASQSEIEEALRILRLRGFAKETSLSGHWFIQS